MFINADLFKVLTKINTYEFNTIFCDPPYNLSSKWEIKNDRVVAVSSKDIDNAWEGLDSDKLEIMFKEFYRIMKFGGYCVMYGVDRQLFAFQYYAIKAGFEICQSLYWYFVSGYPKGLNVARTIDTKLNLKGEVVSERVVHDMTNGAYLGGAISGERITNKIHEFRKPVSRIAKEFEGYTLGVAPFKPCLETIMVFRKPPKAGNLEDIMDFELDNSISPSAVNTDGSRISSKKVKKRSITKLNIKNEVIGFNHSKVRGTLDNKSQDLGAFPSQMIASNEGAENLDKKRPNCSDILEKVSYECEDLEIIEFSSKSSTEEREEGLESFETDTKKGFNTSPREYDGEVHGEVYRKNTHPTVKPIDLNRRVFGRFCLPKICNQKVFVPFSGVGSEYIGVLKNNIPEDNILGVELTKKWYEIAIKRAEFHSRPVKQQTLF